jgi:hypothetical protein
VVTSAIPQIQVVSVTAVSDRPVVRITIRNNFSQPLTAVEFISGDIGEKIDSLNGLQPDSTILAAGAELTEDFPLANVNNNAIRVALAVTSDGEYYGDERSIEFTKIRRRIFQVELKKLIAMMEAESLNPPDEAISHIRTFIRNGINNPSTQKKESSAYGAFDNSFDHLERTVKGKSQEEAERKFTEVIKRAKDRDAQLSVALRGGVQ